MNTGIVPDDDDMPAKVTEKMAEKSSNIATDNICFEKAGVETKPSLFWADRQGRDNRDAVVTIPVMNDGRASAWCPCLANGRNDQKAGFVYKDDVRAQPRGVFFTRGQSSSFHLFTLSSLRSIARRSGF